VKKEIKKSVYVLIILLLIAGAALPAQTGKSGQDRTPLRVPEIAGRVQVDGVLDEAVWQKALKLELDYEVFPGENTPPPVRTDVYIAYTAAYFYVAFRAYDKNTAAIRAQLSERDNIETGDWVGVCLDTFNARRRAYTFSCNPLGIQAEAVETNAGSDAGWDTIWASAGRIVADGYIVEMAIPFRSLRFQRKQGEQVWGFNARRNYPRSVEHSIGLIPEDRNNFCLICQYPKIIGFRGAKAGRNVEIDPSLSALSTQQRDELTGEDWQERKNKFEPGLTAHWGITPNLTLSTALNPDFSNIEADVAQLDTNKQFALYYPEKRPFFLEGAGIFETGLQAVYTRSLADPRWGVKMTGKEGRHGLGFYSVRDNITNLVFPGSRGSTSAYLGGESTGTVMRYRCDVGKESNVGILLTDREGGDYYNRLAGVDTYWRFSPQKFITCQFITSGTRYSQQVAAANGQPEGKITGTALDFVIRHVSRNVGYFVNYRQVSPGFRADLGFMPQAGYRHLNGVFILAAWGTPNLWYTFMNAITSFEYESDYNGDLLYRSANLTANYYGPGQTQITLYGNSGKRKFMEQIFSTDNVQVNFSIKPTVSLHLWLGGLYGKQIDYVNVRPGTQVMINPGIEYRIGRRIFLSLDHVYEQLDVEAGRLYTANVANLKMEYHFSRRAFLRTIMQYVDYKYNIGNYLIPMDPESKHFFTQVLFSYRLNPQTMFFLGYSDNRYGEQGVPLTRTNRTLFLKIGYALTL
jgi:hypothetical protein